MSNIPAFAVDDVDLPALRAAVSRIARADYSERPVRERLGLSDITDLQWRASPIYRRERLATRDPLATAIDLFLLQGRVPVDELNRLINPDDREVLLRTGLLSIDEMGFAVAGASLFPVGVHLVFSDHAWPQLPHPGWATVPQDQVMFVGTDSRWLARATVRRRAGSALDLCTGSGVHALLAASHANRVLAVDLSARAVQCTQFNARVSCASNVEVKEGDLFQPVAGELFDLITANPPFVPSPLNSLRYRDGGPSGEDVQRRIVEGLPDYLAPGGIAQIVTELGEGEKAPLADRLRTWLGSAPMDVHILRLRVHSAASYAIGHAQCDDDYGGFLDSVDEWASNLGTQGYSHIVSVLITFQWSDPAFGPPWTCIQEALPPTGDAGSEIEATFSRQRIARQPDLPTVLEGCTLRPSGPIALLETRMLGGDATIHYQARLLGKALPIDQQLDRVERDILVAARGPLTWPEILALAAKLKINQTVTMATIRSLLARGLIVLECVQPTA